MPTPVSITGTFASLTTRWISDAPPRGMTTSTKPRAPSSSPTDARSAGSSSTEPAGSPAFSAASVRTATRAVLVRKADAEPRSSAALPLLRHSPAASTVTFGPGLVDDPDDPEGHPDLAQLQAVGQPRPADDVADRVGQRHQLAQRGGHAGDAAGVEPQPVEHRLGGALGGRGVDVGRVGREDLVGPLHQGVRHRGEGGVLDVGRQRAQHPRGGAGAQRGGPDQRQGGDVGHAREGSAQEPPPRRLSARDR